MAHPGLDTIEAERRDAVLVRIRECFDAAAHWEIEEEREPADIPRWEWNDKRLVWREFCPGDCETITLTFTYPQSEGG